MRNKRDFTNSREINDRFVEKVLPTHDAVKLFNNDKM